MPHQHLAGSGQVVAGVGHASPWGALHPQRHSEGHHPEEPKMLTKDAMRRGQERFSRGGWVDTGP